MNRVSSKNRSPIMAADRVLLVFSVMPLKIDQNKNQNRLIDIVQNLRKKGKNANTSIRGSGHSNHSFLVIGRYGEKYFTGPIYRDLYGDAMLMPIWMGTNMAARNQP